MRFFPSSHTRKGYEIRKIQEMGIFITFFNINIIYIKKLNNVQKSLLIYFTYINICNPVYIIKCVCYNQGVDIKSMRTSKGITQARLAEMTGLSQQHISKIERGETAPLVSTLGLILRALGYEIDLKEGGNDRKTP